MGAETGGTNSHQSNSVSLDFPVMKRNAIALSRGDARFRSKALPHRREYMGEAAAVEDDLNRRHCFVRKYGK